MKDDRIWDRTTRLAVGAIELVERLPKSVTSDVIGRQLLRCATSAGANYRATKRARSRREFVARMGVVEEEADEASYWIWLLSEVKLVDAAAVHPMKDYATEIVAMSVASIKTARRGLQKSATGDG